MEMTIAALWHFKWFTGRELCTFFESGAAEMPQHYSLVFLLCHYV